jgi:hypothetical protein
MTTDAGRIIYEDAGRITAENGSSRRHGIIITVDYTIDVETQLMTYHVMVGERMVQQAFDVPYSFETLHTLALQTFFKSHRTRKDIKIRIEEVEPHG